MTLYSWNSPEVQKMIEEERQKTLIREAEWKRIQRRNTIIAFVTLPVRLPLLLINIPYRAARKATRFLYWHIRWFLRYDDFIYWMKHKICQRKGHVPVPGWRTQGRSSYRNGYICDRCGDWLQDVGKKMGHNAFFNTLMTAARDASEGHERRKKHKG